MSTRPRSHRWPLVVVTGAVVLVEAVAVATVADAAGSGSAVLAQVEDGEA